MPVSLIRLNRYIIIYLIYNITLLKLAQIVYSNTGNTFIQQIDLIITRLFPTLKSIFDTVLPKKINHKIN